ncbi:ATP-dependent protease La [Thelephora ganbajun]|uniref:ATP-dependent protease La n=1 Tax=Thelephora ganbajun TaxID=370292 RepID=A0ACB6ZIX2_THEGA|nr:ATP-dependent protease La [Thelephora ganbajun]
MILSNTQLPTIPLPHPQVLLPNGRISLLVSRNIGDHLFSLVEESSEPTIVAAIPIVTPPTGASDPVLSEYGVAARVVRLGPSSNSHNEHAYHLTIAGLVRIHLPHGLHLTTDQLNTLTYCTVEHPPSGAKPTRSTLEATKAAAVNLLDKLAKSGPRKDYWSRMMHFIEGIDNSRIVWLADAMTSAVDAEFNDKLEILATTDTEARLQAVTQLFVKLASIFEVSSKIASVVDESLSKQQKEYFLRQKLAAIQKELQNLNRQSKAVIGTSGNPPSELDDDDQADADDMAQLRQKIEAMTKDSEERKVAVSEWRRLKRIPPGSAENAVIRTYLEWLASIPWASSSSRLTALEVLKDRQFLSKARKQLDADHYGLDKIKKRLIEYLAIVRLKELAVYTENEKALVLRMDNPSSIPPPINRVKGPILLFVGPPGTGKTSITASLARALDRPFERISLGGVRDEAEIRGHRRTYVASGPGSIVQALKKAGRPDPIILLDEIDKVGHNNFHGDPSAALLEVLDPEQNHTFRDHYLNVPVDLSQVLFICTANSLDPISPPLLDRCEVVHLSGYTYDEKLHIASQFLLPKQLKANGLGASHIVLTEPALLQIVTGYTREAGVRSLERAIGSVVRYKAMEWAEHDDQDGGKLSAYEKEVKVEDLEKLLGIPRYDGEKERTVKRGVVYGLVVSGLGEGGVLPVETCTIPGKGDLRLTGSLGDVIKESSSLALSWVKAYAYDLQITSNRSEDPLKVPNVVDVHLHLPAGAQKKDGPSAGVAMVCALVSLFTGLCVPVDTAMTGEITLRGRVEPVGGIKEKVLGAHRAGMKKVILPWANRKDVDHDVPREIKDDMQFFFVKTVSEGLDVAFGKGTVPWRRPRAGFLLESRL